MTNLFIIGNGFDFQHNVHYLNGCNEKINTSLDSFSQELKKRAPEIYNKINNRIEKRGFSSWNSLEEIDFEKLFTNGDRSTFYSELKAWIKNLDKNISYQNFSNDQEKVAEYNRIKDIISNDKTFFINFNYTKTIEKLYGYCNKIIHLHGDSSYPILAYSIEQPFRENFRPPGNFGPVNDRKPTGGVKVDLSKWMKDNIDHNDLKKIYIYGFNFSGMDREYLQHVLACLKTKVKAVKICDYQAKSIRNNEKCNLKANIINLINIYSNYGTKIEFVDFDDNKL